MHERPHRPATPRPGFRACALHPGYGADTARPGPAIRPNTSARSTDTALGAVPWKWPVISPAAWRPAIGPSAARSEFSNYLRREIGM